VTGSSISAVMWRFSLLTTTTTISASLGLHREGDDTNLYAGEDGSSWWLQVWRLHRPSPVDRGEVVSAQPVLLIECSAHDEVVTTRSHVHLTWRANEPGWLTADPRCRWESLELAGLGSRAEFQWAEAPFRPTRPVSLLFFFYYFYPFSYFYFFSKSNFQLQFFKLSLSHEISYKCKNTRTSM
jgi:hypothetical protein